MKLNDLLQLVNFIVGKFPTGNSMRPSDINQIIPNVQDTLYGEELDKLLAISMGRPEVLNRLISTSILNPFKKINDGLVPVDGIIALPNDYVRYLSAATVIGGGIRTIDIVGVEDFNRMRGDVFTRADINPFAKISNEPISPTDNVYSIFIIPKDITALSFDYLRKPSVPYYDWCQDAENPNKLVYLPAGGFIKVDTTTIEIFNVYDHANVLVYSNVIQKGTSLVYISLTKELEWEDYIHYKFVSRILSRVGINLAEDKVVQYAELQQKEGK